jgi:hypothetical protein
VAFDDLFFRREEFVIMHDYGSQGLYARETILDLLLVYHGLRRPDVHAANVRTPPALLLHIMGMYTIS